MKEDIYAIIGKRTRQEREKLGLTQEELADKAGIHPSFFGQIERGTKKASIVTLQRIADALGVSADILLKEGNIKGKTKKLSEYQVKVTGLMGNFQANEQKFLYNTTKELYKNIKKRKK